MRSYAGEQKIADAVRILAHYLKGSANDNEDMAAELETVVQCIVDAAVSEVESIRAQHPTQNP